MEVSDETSVPLGVYGQFLLVFPSSTKHYTKTFKYDAYNSQTHIYWNIVVTYLDGQLWKLFSDPRCLEVCGCLAHLRWTAKTCRYETSYSFIFNLTIIIMDLTIRTESTKWKQWTVNNQKKFKNINHWFIVSWQTIRVNTSKCIHCGLG